MASPTVEGFQRAALLIGVALTVIVLDQLTKHWALSALADRDLPIVWTLRLHLERNSGAAFSFGAGTGWARWLPLLALGVVVVLLVQAKAVSTRLGAVALGMVIGGALSNLLDRLFRGEGAGFFQGRVVDFIDVQWWPVFNIADSAVVVGGILLVIVTVIQPPPGADEADAGGEVVPDRDEDRDDAHRI